MMADKLPAYDTIALSLLMSTPHGLLLSLFYSIRPTTILFTTTANIISINAPFILMRGALPAHAPLSAPKGTVRNRSILSDPWTTISTSLLATAIFAVLLELSFATFLPVHLITHFTGVRDITVTHLGAAGLPSLLVALVPAGYAAREFLFVSSTGIPPSPEKYTFDPTTADLRQHVYHNSWGWYSTRQQELISRATLLAVMVVGETIIHTWGTIKGVEFWGAACYAALWAVGVAVLGAVFDWVGAPSG
jgi:archaellum biogenesis protein FlaJ (TadC family)